MSILLSLPILIEGCRGVSDLGEDFMRFPSSPNLLISRDIMDVVGKGEFRAEGIGGTAVAGKRGSLVWLFGGARAGLAIFLGSGA